MPKQRSSNERHGKTRFVDDTNFDNGGKEAEVRDGMIEVSSVKDIHRLYFAMGKAAMWQKRANGETMQLAPLGYHNVKKNGRSTIESDPEVYPLVREAKELLRKGRSIRKICRRMKERGLRSQRGNVITPGAMARVVG